MGGLAGRRGRESELDAVLCLDHVYVCTEQHGPDLEVLRAEGLTSGFSRVHTGQGTFNDLILFESNYLELLYLRDREEAEANPLKLQRRFDRAETGASPFGVALRGRRSECAVEAWTPYELEGMRAPIYIVSATLKDDRLPMVFLLEGEDTKSGGPRRWDCDKKLFEHECGARGLEWVELSGPGYERLRDWRLPGGIEFHERGQPLMRVGLAGANFGELELAAPLRLA